jgi:hypothetical protein
MFQELMGQLQDNVANASSKAMSVESVCHANEVRLGRLETQVRDLTSGRDSSGAAASP